MISSNHQCNHQCNKKIIINRFKRMLFRVAAVEDIQQIQIVRNAVKENVLSDPGLVTDNDCIEFITIRGKGWVCEIENKIVGFAIVDLKENNIWALFIDPSFEKRGVGRQLHDTMLDWYFTQTTETVWLGDRKSTRLNSSHRT